MGVGSQLCPNHSLSEKKINASQLPVIDLSCPDRSATSRRVVEACERYGFFKVINHGVPNDVVTRLEEESLRYFSRPGPDKQRVGGPNPFGYGSKNIGFNGDFGEVEYLILDGSGGSSSNDQVSECISPDHPENFRSAVRGYVGAVRGMASDILDLISLSLTLSSPTSSSSSLGGLIRAAGNDSVLRINFYPPSRCSSEEARAVEGGGEGGGLGLGLGFGEHSDPQVVTVLRSNDVGGLQVWVRDGDGEGGWWTAVPPDPTALWVNVGDLLQAMTNGRFQSARHRVVLTTSQKPRMSVAFFGAPPLDAIIAPAPHHQHLLYRPFTWSEYKTAAYSLKLGDSRLHLFRSSFEDDERERMKII